MPSVKGQCGVASGFTPSVKYGVWGDCDTGYGVIGSSGKGTGSKPIGSVGVYGISLLAGQLLGEIPVPGGIGVLGQDNLPLSTGVQGQAAAGTGVVGQGGDVGVYGEGGRGVEGYGAPGVFGSSYSNRGVVGSSSKDVGVVGFGGTVGVSGFADGYGVSGAGRYGVVGSGNFSGNSSGVYGSSQFGFAGVEGHGGGSAMGVYANSTGTADAIRAEASGSGIALHAKAPGFFGRAGVFEGSVAVLGVLSKSGGGFLIDHPSDPANRYLRHSFVESSEMKNIYDGVAVLDRSGKATVAVPDWFGALNKDFRYQLTAVGASAPNLHISAELSRGRFQIAGGPPRGKVSWQISGIRQDPWAKANPLKVDDRKRGKERGRYLHPGLYRKAKSAAIGWEAPLKRTAKDPIKAAKTVPPSPEVRRPPTLKSVTRGSGTSPQHKSSGSRQGTRQRRSR